MQAKLREGRTNAVGPNDVCEMDFVRDELFDGRKIRLLTVIDIYIRLPPAIGVR
jgi:putative transposase